MDSSLAALTRVHHSPNLTRQTWRHEAWMLSEESSRKSTAYLLAFVVMAAGPACDGSVVRPAPILTAVNAGPYVTGLAVGLVNVDGQFVLPKPPEVGRPQISEARAKQLAIAFIRKFGRFSQESFDRVHGAPIDFGALRAADRAYYAVPPYAQTLPESFHPSRIKRTGPYYLVPLLAGERPVLSVAVSAYNTDIDIGPDGLVRFPVKGGNDFDPLPAPLDQEFSMPVTPERAAQIAFETTGRRVIALPELVLPDLRYAAHFARWRLRLDGPAVLRSAKTGVQYRTSELYVGRYLEVSVALPEQPEGIAVTDPELGTRVTSRRVGDVPVRFETVRPAGRR